MGNPLVEVLNSFKAPEGDFVNEESINDLVQICPAVGSIMGGGEAATSDPINRGFLSAMGIIYDMIAGSGLEECLSGITKAFAERIDKLVISNKFSLVRDGKPLIPALVDLMSGKPQAFEGGVLQALACVVKRAEDDYGPADAIEGYGAPEALPEESTEAMTDPGPVPAPTAPFTDWAKKPTSRPDNTTKVLGELHRLGIPLERISLQPTATDAGIKLSIAIQMGEGVTFEEVAKINAIIMAVLSKPVELTSTSGIWVRLSL